LGGPHLATAIAAFTDAIATLDHDQEAPSRIVSTCLAAVWMNLANARVAETTAESDSLAREAGHAAISLVARVEANDADSEEVGLKARHVLC
jgi:hypothetical protein